MNIDPKNSNPRPVGYRGHDVVDPTHRLIGTICDVVYDSAGGPEWAVVDLGLLRSSHYVPIATGYMSDAGEFVVPYDKTIVKAAPKADRSHLLDPETKSELQRHYRSVLHEAASLRPRRRL